MICTLNLLLSFADIRLCVMKRDIFKVESDTELQKANTYEGKAAFNGHCK